MNASMDSLSPSGIDSEVMDVELDSSMYFINPVFACDSLPGSFSKHLSRPIEDREAINARSSNFQNGQRARSARLQHSPSLFVDEGEESNSLRSEDVHEELQDIHENANSSDIDGVDIKQSPSVSSFNHGTYRRARVQGGCPAVPKKVTADLDAEDQIILEMKSAGIRDSIVAARLVNEGGTNYDPKTIATRYSRIRRVLYAAEQVRLDDSFSDYYEEEDNHIVDAYEETEVWYAREFEALQNSRWKMVAENIRNKLGKHKYSTNACRTRFDDLLNGTGCIPQDRDPNPELRAAEAKIKSEERMAATRVVKAKLKEEEDAKVRARLAERIVKEKKRAKLAAEKAAIEAKKAEAILEKQRAFRAVQDRKQAELEKKRAAAEKVRQKKEMKAKQDADDKARVAWEMERRRRTSRQHVLDEKLEALLVQAAELQNKKQELEENANINAIIRRRLYNAGIPLIAPLSNGSNSGATSGRKSNRNIPNISCNNLLDEDGETTTSLSFNTNVSNPKLGLSTNSTTPSSSTTTATPAPSLYLLHSSPRTSVSTPTLRALLRARQLSTTGTKSDLVNRLAEDDANKTVGQLQYMMGERGLKKTGSKMDLVRRLAEHDAAQDAG